MRSLGSTDADMDFLSRATAERHDRGSPRPLADPLLYTPPPFPPWSRPCPASPAPSRSHRLPRGRSESILCVDDENIFLEVVQKHLEELGYQVRACPSSVQALEHLRADPAAFDLIITDQTMPEMTGVQLAADIREINQTLPLILCTGHSEAVTAQTAKRLGITSILMKPITRSELARTVHRVLRDKRS